MAKQLKIETEEHKALRKAKEQKEIAKWEKEKAKPKLKGYIFYFLFVITIVYIVDEITTQIGGQLENLLQIVFDLKGETGTAALKILGFISIIASAAALFYKPLSDRFGRKIFLVINTLGMGLGLFLVGITTNISLYVIGTLVIAFFTPHDMQVTYIQECCPKDKRGRYYTIIKSIATLGMLLIPLLKNMFIKDNDYSKWGFTYLIPAALALVISIFALFQMRETDPFMDSRLKYLRMTDEEREQAKKAQDAVAQKEGLIEGFKYIYKHKALWWLALASALLWAGYGITSNYNVIMKMGFLGIDSAEKLSYYANTEVAPGITFLSQMYDQVDVEITKSLYAFAIGSAIAQLLPGFVADKWGRKPAAVFASVFSLVTFVLFWIGAFNSWNKFIVGLCSGAAVGAFWLVGDMCQFIVAELVPTSCRVSVGNAMGLLFYPGLGIGMLIPTFIAGFTSDYYLPILTLIISVIGMAAGSVILMLKVKETKGVDMEEITGNE